MVRKQVGEHAQAHQRGAGQGALVDQRPAGFRQAARDVVERHLVCQLE
jgi:hypothetical protein